MKRTKFLFLSLAIPSLFLLGSCKHDKHDCKDHDHHHADVELVAKPMIMDVEEATIENESYQTESWTGKYLQLVFMSLKPGEVIDLEVHEDHDQFIRIEKGEARVLMGLTKDDLNFDEKVSYDWAILIPAGYWHKIENIGETDLKIYTLYGPPEHAKGTDNKTYKDAKENHKH